MESTKHFSRHIFCSYAALAAALLLTSPASAEVPEGVFYSDHDAYFNLENTQSGRDDTGWYVEARARMYGDNIPADSGFKYVLKQGRRTLATFMCDADFQQRHLGTTLLEGQLGEMTTDRCNSRDTKLQVVGDVQAEVYFINGDDDSETLVRTHTLGVRSFERANNARQYYIEFNGGLVSSVVHECVQARRPALCLSGAARSQSYGYVGVFMWIAETRHNGLAPSAGRWGQEMQIRCSVDGERLQTTRNDRGVDSTRRATRVMASTGRGRQDERDQYHFEEVHLRLPITVGEPFDGMVRLEDHPGQWQCDIRQERQVIRSVRFQVADGHILPHPEEAAGNVHLHPSGHLADVVIPADAAMETRVSPDAGARGPFFGVGWATDEGRAIGTALPTIGTAQLAGQPRARRARRGRRGRR
ncbi:MAG: hypothetical protein AB8H86_15445 [Polyangiales bacterium]